MDMIVTPESPGNTKMGNLDSLFQPRSVAVLGVTNTPGTVPHDIFANLINSDFNGVVYPVAPRKKEILGVRAFDYVVDIPEPVDLAVLVFPGMVCERALTQCVEKGVKAAVIISAGFRESGPEGLEREQRIQAIADEAGMRILGPNCLGVINCDPDVRLNASFARNMPSLGRIAFASQSGALCTAVLDYAAGKNIGFSKFVSLGNKADIDDVDLLYYLADDPQTSVILMYLEGIARGRDLMRAADEIAGNRDNPKPILAIKSGRTAAGAAAAQSHTGSLASSAEVCDSAFKQSGIIHCQTIEDMFNTAQLFANQPLPRGDRLAIITNAGGPGVMATDAAISHGLELAKFSEETGKKLRAALPKAANTANPIDVIGDARDDRYAAALEAVYSDPGVDQILTILTPQSMTNIAEIAETVRDVSMKHHDSGKTMSCSFMGAQDVLAGIHILERAEIPHYILPEAAVHAMAKVVEYKSWLERDPSNVQTFQVDTDRATDILARSDGGYLSEPDALEIAKAYGLPITEYEVSRSPQEAVAAAEKIGYPVVLRIASRRIIHKSEVNGVALNLKDAEAVRQAFNQIHASALSKVEENDIDGIIVRPMIPQGHEVIFGINRDPVFGPVIMFGLGGIYVEAFKDVTFRVAPITQAAAREMVRELKTSPILAGLRGQPPSDLRAIEDAIMRLSQLAVECPSVQELDINPMIVHAEGSGCHIADIRIRVGGE
ncbi:MAG: acyl-CoA synthetase [Phycisphaerae bacterium]|nr:MAG: acyl-CoA synthetase [Phycisphaerae bacterium]